MKKSTRGLLLVPFVIFLVLWLVSAGLLFLSYSNGQKTAKKLKTSENQLNSRTLKQIKDKQFRLKQVSNLAGYRSVSEDEYKEDVYSAHSRVSAEDNFYAKVRDDNMFESSVLAIVHKLDTLCTDQDFPGSKSFYGINVDSIKIDEERLIDEAYSRNLVTLEDVWNEYEKRIVQLQKSSESLSKERASLSQQYSSTKSKYKSDVNNNIENIRSKREKIERFRVSKEDELKDAEESRILSQKEKIEGKDKLAKLSREKREKEKKYKSELENLNQRIAELKAETTGQQGLDRFFASDQTESKGQENPDGEVIYVNENLKIAYIDLGRPEGILPGLTFDVFRYGKGGTKVFKGKIEVREVRKNMSMVGITELNDSLSPVTVGDKIINPVYDRNKTTYFVIAGRLTQKYSPIQATRLIEKLGGKIEREITAKTDFIVLSSGFANDPLYQRSVELGIETMLESEFVAYLDN